MDITLLSRNTVAKDLNLLDDEAYLATNRAIDKKKVHKDGMKPGWSFNQAGKDATSIEKNTSDINLASQSIDPSAQSQMSSSDSVTSLDQITSSKRSSSWMNLSSVTQVEREKHHYEDAFGCMTRNFGKGFILGFGGQVTVNVLVILIQMARGRVKQFSNITSGAFLEGAKDMGLFLGSLLSTFNTAMYVSRYVENPTLRRYRGFLSGFISGPALLFLPDQKRSSAVLFLLVRSLELFFSMAAARGSIRSIENGDVMVMSGASAVMIWLFSFYEHTLDPSYVHFLRIHAQFPQAIVKALASMSSGKPIPDLQIINDLRSKNVPPLPAITDPMFYKVDEGNAARLLLYPNLSFAEFALRYFIKGIRLALSVYLPVYFIPLGIFQTKHLIKDPVAVILQALKGVAISSVFLATYCTIGICSISPLRQLGFTNTSLPTFAHLSYAISGALAGLSTFIEKKARRMELGLYVLTKAIEGTWALMKEKGFPVIPGGDVLLTSITFGIVTHCYCRYPKLIRSIYHGGMRIFFDSDERHKFIAGRIL